MRAATIPRRRATCDGRARAGGKDEVEACAHAEHGRDPSKSIRGARARRSLLGFDPSSRRGDARRASMPELDALHSAYRRRRNTETQPRLSWDRPSDGRALILPSRGGRRALRARGARRRRRLHPHHETPSARGEAAFAARIDDVARARAPALARLGSPHGGRGPADAGENRRAVRRRGVPAALRAGRRGRPRPLETRAHPEKMRSRPPSGAHETRLVADEEATRALARASCWFSQRRRRSAEMGCF